MSFDDKSVREEELKKFMRIAIEEYENTKDRPIDISVSLSFYENKLFSELLMILRKKKGMFGK